MNLLRIVREVRPPSSYQISPHAELSAYIMSFCFADAIFSVNLRVNYIIYTIYIYNRINLQDLHEFGVNFTVVFRVYYCKTPYCMV